jgi:hypothetical protein
LDEDEAEQQGGPAFAGVDIVIHRSIRLDAKHPMAGRQADRHDDAQQDEDAGQDHRA